MKFLLVVTPPSIYHKVHRSLLWNLRRDLGSAPEKLFSELKTQITNPPLRYRVRWDWISDKTWATIEARVTAHRKGGQRTVPQISQCIRAGLSTDQLRQVEEAGFTIDSLLVLDPPPCKRGMGPDAGVLKGYGQ